MLQPGNRRLLLDALRPPAGYRLDRAVGTSYSVDLLALLTAPLAFTFFDWEGEDGRPTTDPLALLEAVRRNAERIHLFCQAARLKIPHSGQTLLAVEAHAREGAYDLVVVDCAPTDSTLRLLTLPDVVTGALRVVLRVQQAVSSVVTPLARALLPVPLPGSEVFGDLERLLYQKLKRLRTLPRALKQTLERIPKTSHPMDVMRTGCSMLGNLEPEDGFERQDEVADRLLAALPSILMYWYRFSHDGVRIKTSTRDPKRMNP